MAAATWFDNYGIAGTGLLYIILLVMIDILLFKKTVRNILISCKVFFMLLLYYLEYSNPVWAESFATREQLFLDYGFSTTMVIIISALIISIIFKSYNVEHNKSKQLLYNILPKPVAEELRIFGYAKPLSYQSVSVLFTDFVGFTKIAESMSPEELVHELDLCFSYFDSVMEKYGLEKLKTIGDAYMCAGGLPEVNNTHAVDAIMAALEIQSFMRQTKEIKRAQDLPYWELRIGIHTGPLVAGVIGEKKFAYDIWGDTVNMSSRVESSGEPGKINISSATKDHIEKFFECEYRGKIQIKNKPSADMYFVTRLKKEYSREGDQKLPNEKFRDEYSKL
jgi:adenylate cyclase